MSTPLLTPGPESTPDGATPEPNPSPSTPGPVSRLFRAIGLLILMAAVAAGAAYGVFEWRIQAERASVSNQFTTEISTQLEEALAQVEGLRAQISTEQESLRVEMKKVQEAAAATGLLMEKEGDLTGLQSRLAEIDTLKLDLRTTQEELEAQLKAIEASVKEQVTQSGQQTAEALSLEMKVKNLLVKAQGEILLTQMYWAEGNRGLAKDELAIAHRSLQQALAEAPESAQPNLKRVVDLAEQTKSALILEATSARDQLNLLWHQVSELLGSPATTKQ